MRRFALRLLGVAVLVVLWELNARLAFYHVLAPSLPDSFFPNLVDILWAGARSVSASAYHAALLMTVTRTLAAFGFAALLGVSVALVAARSATFDDIIYYPAEFFRQLPAVAVIPFAIMVFGIYTPMKISVAVFGCFFPILVGAREGLANVDSGLMLTARSYGWTGPRLLFGVMLPAAAPQIIAALRIALAIALILVIMAEMLVGVDGLGVTIVERERTFDFPALYAETILLGLIGVGMNQCFGVLCRYVHYWRGDPTWRTADIATASATWGATP